MIRTSLSFPALLVLFVSFTLNVSDLEAQSARNRIGRSILSEIIGLKGEKRGCCGTRTVTGRLSAVAEEYEYSRLTGTYYTLRDGIQASLMLNNKGPEPILANPTFYSMAGTRLQLAPIVVPATSYLDVDMEQLLANAGDEFREGSLKISYQAQDQQLGAQIKLTNPQKKLIWAEQLVYTSKFASNRLENVWWLPGGNTKTRFVVSNTSSATITATIEVDGTTPSQTAPYHVTLAPWETRVLDILSDLVGNGNGNIHSTGGISIEHNGQPGQVLARMYVARPSAGYSAAAAFIDPENTASQRWHGSGFRFRNIDGTKLRTSIAVRNVGTDLSRVKGKIIYTKPDGDLATILLPERQIPAGSAKVFDLSTLIDNANVPSSVEVGGIEIDYDTPKGTVITSVQSGSANGEHVFQVPMFDPQKMPSSAGGFPWKAEGNYSTVVYIKNETDTPQKYTAHLIHDAGQYSLGINEIRPGETVAIDFRKLRDEQTPDGSGKIIPVEAERGQIAWSVRGAQNRVLSGRSEQISLSEGVASTYACYNCCPNSTLDTWINPTAAAIVYEAHTWFIANQTESNCYQQQFGPYVPGGVAWYSSNTNVASVFDGQVFGEGAGTADISATIDTVLWFYWGDGYCEPWYDQVTRYAPVEVEPNVTLNVPLTAVDGTFANFGVVVSGATPTGFSWSFETPSGAGNNPQVNFDAPSESVTTAKAHWFALPDSPCPTTPPPVSSTHPYYNSKYKIKATVSYSGGEVIKEADFTVNAYWYPAGSVGVPQLTGLPARALNAQNLWVFTGPGTLSRVTQRTPTINVPSTSQFYNKTLAHENVHIPQWNSGQVLGNYVTVNGFVSFISNLSASSENALLAQLPTALNNYLITEVNAIISSGALSQAEIAAYNVSDPIAPMYAYQRCGRTVFP